MKTTFFAPLFVWAASKTAKAVTVYTSETGTAAFAQYTVASTDQTVLTPPSPPDGEAQWVGVQLFDGGQAGMGLPVVSPLMGY